MPNSSSKLFCLALSFSVVGMLCTSTGAWSATASSAKVKSTRPTIQPAFEKKIFKGNVSADVTSGEQELLTANYKQASTFFWKALNKNSKDTAALCGLGFSQALQFQLDNAEQQFSKALKIKPQDPLAHVGMAFVTLSRLQTSSTTVLKQRDSMLQRALAECATALKAEPKMAEALLVQGLVQKEQGKFDAASASFTRSIESNPNFSAPYAHRGMISLVKNNPSAAAADFEQAIRIRSSNSTAHYGLGRAYLKMGQLDSAYKELNTAISLNRNSAPAHIAMGDVLQQQGNSVAAIKEYKAAIAIKAESEEAYLKLADIMQGRGDLEFAVADLRSGLEIKPNNIDLHRRLGDILLNLGKLDDAINEYNTVLQMYPGDVASISGMTRGLTLKAQKEASGAFFVSNNFEAAERTIQQAIKMNPNNMELRLADAKLRAISGKQIDLSTVGTPTNDPQRLAYAEACLAQFKFDDAKQAMATVISNCQNSKDTFAVADMALMIRDLDSSEAAYKKAGSFGGTDDTARSQRGLAAVSSARSKAQQDLTLATDLAKRSQFASSLDKFRNAAYLNPRLSQAHLGLAQTLEKFEKKQSPALREASLHYKAYLALEPNLPEKEREKITKRSDKCLEIAYKIDSGHPPSKFSAILSPIGNIGRKVGEQIKEAMAD